MGKVCKLTINYFQADNANGFLTAQSGQGLPDQNQSFPNRNQTIPAASSACKSANGQMNSKSSKLQDIVNPNACTKSTLETNNGPIAFVGYHPHCVVGISRARKEQTWYDDEPYAAWAAIRKPCAGCCVTTSACVCVCVGR